VTIGSGVSEFWYPQFCPSPYRNSWSPLQQSKHYRATLWYTIVDKTSKNTVIC